MRWIEKRLWLIVFAATLLPGLLCVFDVLEPAPMDRERVAATLFEFSLIGGGFLFTVYSVLISATGGFVGRLREDGSGSFIAVLRRLRHIIFASFATALGAMPFMVGLLDPAAPGVVETLFFLWLAVAVATVAYFMYSLVLIGLVLAPVK